MKLEKALPIATKVLELLKPDCDKIHIAGSIRRELPDVKDIEIVCLPSVDIHRDMFGVEVGRIRKKDFVLNATCIGKGLKGSAVDGRYKQIALDEGIILDLFMPDEKDFYRQLAIRTGSSWFSKNVLAVGWTRLGWCGTEFGLRKMSDCQMVKTPDLKVKWKVVNNGGVKPPVWQSEEEFFEWLRIKWVEPKNRI